MATLETENGSVEQDLGTISQGELAVAKVFAFLLIFRNLLIVCALSGRVNDPLTSDCDGLGGGSDEGEVRSKGFPLRNFKVLGVDEVGSKGGRIHGVDVARGDLGTRFLVDLDKGVGELTSFSVLERGEVRTITLRNLADLAQGGDGTSDNTSGFWVSDGGLNLEETGEKAGKERTDGDVRVDELGHVVDDDSDLSLGGGQLLGKTTRQERDHEGKGGRIYFRNECGGREEGNGARNLLDRINKSFNKSRNKAFYVLVRHQSGGFCK
jgi:hypothetical protein